MNRRHFLLTGVTVGVVLAGCAEENEKDGENETTTEDGENETTTEDGENETTTEDAPSPPDQSSLTLTVVDPDGEPIESASVAGQGNPHDADIPLTFNGETDVNGQYTNVIYQNEYTIDIDHPDYEATTVTHTHDGESELTVELAPETDETYELTVEVLSGMPDPLANATVTAGDQTGQTNNDGVATFELEGGTYTVEATADAYYPEATEVTVEDDESVRLVLERNYEGIEITDHDVFVTEREDDVDTIDAEISIENQSDYDSGNLWIDVTVYDDAGEVLGEATSSNVSVPPNDRAELQVEVRRSSGTEFPDDMEIGSYELILDSLENPDPIDTVSSEQGANMFTRRGSSVRTQGRKTLPMLLSTMKP